MANHAPKKAVDVQAPKPPFERLKGWAVGLTGVLVVLPALVNSGFDVYSVVAKLPKTETEKINDELFRKYFNKQPIAVFPVPVKRDAASVDVNFSIFDGGDIYIEFGKRSQWFPFPRLEKTSLAEPLSLIRTAIAAEATNLEGSGQYRQTDRLQGDKIIRERLWENGVLETFVIDPRSGRIMNRTSRQAPPSVSANQPAFSDPVQAEWLSRVEQERIGPLALQRFRDPVYVLVTPIAWRPNSANGKLPAVSVPRGFVTELGSIPKMFWSLLPADGTLAYAAVIHDYLYWTQSTDRETADSTFREILIELKVPSATVEALYSATKIFGNSAWMANSAAKKAGEKRVIALLPDDPSIKWTDWKKRSDVFR
jgi:hypothetical protein